MAGLTTTTEISAPVNVIFQTTLLRNAKALCPYFQPATPATVTQHGGTFTAKWRRIENLTPVSSPLAELTGSLAFPTRTADQPTITDVTATVSKYGNFIFLNEEVDLVNFNGQTDKLMEVLGINAGQSLNRLQRDEMEDNFQAFLLGTATTATGISNATGSGSTVNLTGIAAAVNYLDRNSAMKFMPQTLGSTNIGTAPVRSSYWGYCHSDVEQDVRLLTGFQSVETYAGQTETVAGEFGHVGGVRWISTPESSIDTGTGQSTAATSSATGTGRAATGGRADVYNSVIVGMDAVGSLGFGNEHVKSIYKAGDNLPAVMAISHERGSAGAADPLNEVGSIGYKTWHAAKVLNSNWGTCLRGTASRLQSAG